MYAEAIPDGVTTEEFHKAVQDIVAWSELSVEERAQYQWPVNCSSISLEQVERSSEVLIKT